MARSQATKRVTRKGSIQMKDKERASQVASLKRPPSPTTLLGEIDDNDPGGSPFFTLEIMQGVREAQKKRAKMTPEEIVSENLRFQWPTKTKMQCMYQNIWKEGNGDHKYLWFSDF